MKYVTFLILLSTFSSFGQAPRRIDLEKPPLEVSLLGEGFLSTFLNERDFAISPDGSEILFTISTPRSSVQTIVSSKKEKNNEWSAPEVASFAGMFSDLEPAFSPDGKTLYFASNRPLAAGGKAKDFDLWKVTRKGDAWDEPENLGTVVNTSGDEFYPSVANNGNLYFTAAYAGGPGKEDIYISSFSNEAYSKPVPLDTAVNSKFYEFNAFVSPDEKFILLTSYGRKDDSGGGDLYISAKDSSGKWMPCQNIKEINSPRLDYCPYVSPSGKALFFTSERHQLPSSFTDEKATYKKIKDATLHPLNGTGNIFWCDKNILHKYLQLK